MYRPTSTAKFSLPAFLLAATSWPVFAQSVVVLPDAATPGGSQLWSETITGDFSGTGVIASGSTTLANALTFTSLPQGDPDSHQNGRWGGGAVTPVNYGFSTPRTLTGILLWNYNEIWQGVLYNDRGITRADITVTHSGGTTVFDNVPFTKTPNSGGATQTCAAQQFNFGTQLNGVTQITLGDLQGGNGGFIGWMSFAAIQASGVVPLVKHYWDGNSFDGDANGGSGTWDTTTANWDTAATGGSDVAWPQGGNAVFGGNFNGLVALTPPVTANTLTFDVAGYVLSGGTLTIAGTDRLLLANQGATINSALGGSAAVTKAGSGQLSLGGDGSAFTGSLSNVGGNLIVTSPNWASASFNAVGGLLAFNHAGTITVKTLTLGNAVQLNNGTRLDIAGGTLAQAGGGGSIATGTGAAGSITSSSGTLTLDAPVTTGQTIGVTLADFNGTTPLAVKLDGPGGDQIGNIALSTANTYTGGTTLNSGRLNAQNAAALGTGPVAVNQDAQAYLTAAGPFLNDFSLSGTGWQETAGQLGALRLLNTTVSGDVTIEAAGARIVAYTGEAGTLSGSLLGSGNLEINIPGNANAIGAITLGGDGSAYTGTATVAQGRLNVTGTLGSSATVTVADTGTLGGEGSIAGDLNLGVAGGATLAVNATTPGVLSAGDVTLNGVTTLALQGTVSGGVPVPILSHTGNLTDANGGTLSDSFNAAGYRSPLVSDNAGTLRLTVATENVVWTGTASGTWETGGPTSNNWNSSDTLFFNGDAVTFDDTAVNGIIAISGTPLPASVTFNNSSLLEYNLSGGAIGGSSNLTKNNDGIVAFASPLNLTGSVTVNGGVLRVNSTVRNAAGITVNAGGFLETGATNIFVADHSVPMANSRVITIDGGQWAITATHDARFGNVVLANGGTLVSDRAVTAWDALMANTDTGPATLSVTGTGASVMEGTGGIHLQGVQNFSVADTTGSPAADLTVSMILAGPGSAAGAAGGVNKTGAGTMLLNGANTYAGATTVTAGTLGGSGSVTSPVTVHAGATLAPGAGLGTFTVTGDVTIDGTLAIEVDGTTTDQLAVTGTLDLAGSTLAFSQLSAPTETSYVIASATSITGSPSISGLPAGYEVNISATQVTLEPVGTGTPFENWIDNFTQLTDPADKLATADPDKDGTDNLTEFAFAGNPTDPADKGKVFLVKGDGADPGSAPQLILTLAVRESAVFGAPPSPAANIDGLTYTVQGSLNLNSFDAPVSTMPAAVLPPSPPLLGDGWEWRSFSLNGSNNFPGKGFMRARAATAP